LALFLFRLPSLKQTQSQPKTKVLRHLKRGEYSIGSSRANQTTRPVVGDFVDHILSTAERNRAIGFSARKI